MICAGKGARVIANIWNGSLDKRNICTMLREKQTEEQERKCEGKQQNKMEKRKSSERCGCAHIIKPLERNDAANLELEQKSIHCCQT